MNSATTGQHTEAVDVAVVTSEVQQGRYEDAVVAGGGRVVPADADPAGLVWTRGPDGLGEAINGAPNLRWVQLGGAGIESFVEAGVLDPRLAWTSAKGSYAKPVAEHALALALALLRQLGQRARATSWGTQSGTSLHGLNTLTIGGGGIGTEIVRLLSVFDTEDAVVRRSAGDVPHAVRTGGMDTLDTEMAHADVVFVAAALTPQTAGLLNRERLFALPDGAVLVNIARGGLVDTAALLEALDDGPLAGAGLDVTDPEPLPDGHPLWHHERALITPHTADTIEMMTPLLAERITRNVQALRGAGPLEGVVDLEAGY